jgi:hypothetical protein
VIEIVAKVLGVSSESGKATYECYNMDGWLKGTITVIEACGWMRDFDLRFAVDGEIQPLKSADAEAENSEADSEATAVSEAAANAKFHIEASFNRKPGRE